MEHARGFIAPSVADCTFVAHAGERVEIVPRRAPRPWWWWLALGITTAACVTAAWAIYRTAVGHPWLGGFQW